MKCGIFETGVRASVGGCVCILIEHEKGVMALHLNLLIRKEKVVENTHEFYSSTTTFPTAPHASFIR